LKISKSTVAFAAYQSLQTKEIFQCNYGFNQSYIEDFKGEGVTFSGFDNEGYKNF